MGNNGFEFHDNSVEVKKILQANINRGLGKAALIVEAQAKANVTAAGRVDSGQLRDRINHKVVGSGNETTAQIGSNEKHAIYNEFGTGEFAENGAGRKGGWFFTSPDGSTHFTRGLKPAKFMRNAFRSKKKQTQQIISDEIGKGL
ncbi:hypothetical protein COC69_05745 [Bacillus cereus]|uniref:HK97 gp10 family phage protein n=1 Tax=Bacillus cereus TaxID=1396 RepID=A0A9X7CQR0_BACCE|nr:HK97-gp10 family putative phage morphogenesis protein [Bacillus cereus]PGS81633.1 hypothetical protein COC69_05745 [Bacillus cereus]